MHLQDGFVIWLLRKQSMSYRLHFGYAASAEPRYPDMYIFKIPVINYYKKIVEVNYAYKS